MIRKYKDGSQYVGDSIDGHKHGRGKYTYPNGDTFEGSWIRGRKHGPGTYTYFSTGEIKTGNWIRGRFIEPKVNRPPTCLS